jgi:hypothetical protein|tara:strand:- start:2893 stop:3372 length:480 start_codon:yes stop_codon:yes gene_type:complete
MGFYDQEDERRDDPYNQNDLYVNPYRSGDKSAQDTLADLYENEFEDYLRRFFPVEQDLIQQMTTGFEGLQQEEIGRAQSAVARQYANTRGQEQRRQAGFGINQGQGGVGDFQRSETSALVAARNFAKMRSEERRTQILSGGLGSNVTQKSVIQGGGLNG